MLLNSQISGFEIMPLAVLHGFLEQLEIFEKNGPK